MTKIRTQADRDREARKAKQPPINGDGEVVLELANGYTIRSAAEDLWAGEYVRVVAPNGDEVLYWHYNEWQEDPILVMGAFLNVAIRAKEVHAERAKEGRVVPAWQTVGAEGTTP